MSVCVSHLGFHCGSPGKESACNVGDLGLILGLGRSPGEGKTTHSSILAWRIPWTIESMGFLQARILEWVAMPSSSVSSQPKDQTQISRIAGGFFTI